MDSAFVNLPLLAIIGPTCSGKSSLAIKLAKKLNGAVFSADSQQVYRQAKIGTNQPTGTWRTANRKWQKATGKKQLFFVDSIPHFFIDSLLPNKQYSAALFQAEALKLCLTLSTEGILPIMAGGTGLYVSSIVEGFKFPQGKPKLHLRQRLDKLSTSKLQQRLKSLDLTAWQKIDLANRRRIIRALEHIISTGEPFSSARLRQIRPNTLIIGLKPPKPTLRQDIAIRTEKMFRQGLVAEVHHLQKNYPHSPLLKSIGYRETIDYLNGKINKAETKEQIINHTWQYARRQITWFKKIPNVSWIKTDKQAELLIKQFLKNAK